MLIQRGIRGGSIDPASYAPRVAGRWGGPWAEWYAGGEVGGQPVADFLPANGIRAAVAARRRLEIGARPIPARPRDSYGTAAHA